MTIKDLAITLSAFASGVGKNEPSDITQLMQEIANAWQRRSPLEMIIKTSATTPIKAKVALNRSGMITVNLSRDSERVADDLLGESTLANLLNKIMVTREGEQQQAIILAAFWLGLGGPAVDVDRMQTDILSAWSLGNLGHAFVLINDKMHMMTVLPAISESRAKIEIRVAGALTGWGYKKAQYLELLLLRD
jgi:hypothetical protein